MNGEVTKGHLRLKNKPSGLGYSSVLEAGYGPVVEAGVWPSGGGRGMAHW